jgi:hypothetical protein
MTYLQAWIQITKAYHEPEPEPPASNVPPPPKNSMINLDHKEGQEPSPFKGLSTMQRNIKPISVCRMSCFIKFLPSWFSFFELILVFTLIAFCI